MLKRFGFDQDSLGPVQNMVQAYFGNLDALAQGYEPMFKGVVRMQLELSGLAARRALAAMDTTTRLSRCRTPEEFGAETTEFWQKASQQYIESAQRMMAAYALAMTPPTSVFANNGKPKSQAKPSKERARDFITFPEPKAKVTPKAKPTIAPVEQRKVA